MAGTQDQQEYRRSGIRAVQSTPLRSRTGRPLGMISTHWRTPHTPTGDDFTLFDVLARQAADLIERTLAEEALRDSEERFRLIADTAPVMIWMTGADKLITYLNQTWLDYTGRRLDATLGHQRIDVLHPDEEERCRDVYEKAFARREPFQMEHLLRRHDGEYRKVVTTGVPRYNVDGPFAGYIGTAIDITERKLAEEALSTVSQKLIEAHEEESARIARELHDDVNQRLAMVSVRLGILKQSPPASAANLEQEIGGVSQEIAILRLIFRRCRTTFTLRDWNSWGWKRRRLASAKSCPIGMVSRLTCTSRTSRKRCHGKSLSVSTACCKKPCRMSSSTACRDRPTSHSTVTPTPST